MQTVVGHAHARSAAFGGPPSPPTNASRVGAHLCSSEQTGVCSSAAVPHAGALEETRVCASDSVRIRPGAAALPFPGRGAQLYLSLSRSTDVARVAAARRRGPAPAPPLTPQQALLPVRREAREHTRLRDGQAWAAAVDVSARESLAGGFAT
jgi:hypothetical protein